MMQTVKRTRRLKRYYVDESCLLQYLQSMSQWPHFVARTVITDIPEGSSIEHVYYSMDRRCLTVMVSHPDFPEVPDGEEVPEGMGSYRMTMVQFMAKQADGSYADKEASGQTDQQTWRNRPSML